MNRPSTSPFAAVLLASWTVVAPPAAAQGPGDLVEEAGRWAASGDTTLAVAVLRRAVEQAPNDPNAVFALGTILARTAPTTERDFRQRAEAEALLERAFQLRDGDPAVLVEMGLLKVKQNIRVESRRLLESALDPEREDALPPELAADAHYAIGQILEEELWEVEDLVFIGPAFRRFGSATDPEGATPSGALCPAGVTFFCFNYTRTRDFNLLFEEVATKASDTPAQLYADLEDHYRTALAYAPRHEMAARRLMALYLKLGRTEEFAALSKELLELNADRPYPWLFHGLALYAAEDWEGAAAAFDTGLARLQPDERVAFEDVSTLLQQAQRVRYNGLEEEARRQYEDVLWARSDPLYLVPGNERRLEHVARVTHAELFYGNPERGQHGWESDRGLVHIRWGLPRKVWKIDTGTVLGSGDGGRWVLWNYRLDAPSFIFFSQAGYQTVRFDQGANTAEYSRELAETESASVFQSRVVATSIDLPYQLARFRGTAPELTQVVSYVTADPSRFLLFDGDSVQAGLFLFTPLQRDTVELRQSIPSGATGNLVFTLEAYPSEYEYAVEALAAESRVGGSERGTLSVPGFPAQGLSLSDLVVADGVAPRAPEPTRWTDFSIGASRDLAFGPDEEIFLYFELYGLGTEDGLARYRMELTVEDVTEQGLVSSVVRSLGGLVGLGEDEETRVRFDRTAEPRDGIVPEYLSLTLADADPGDYRIRVVVRDEATGEERETTRDVRIEER